MTIHITNDFIAVYEKDKEIVGWHKDEWIGDPETVVIAIVNAVHLALTDPEKLKEILKKIGKS